MAVYTETVVTYLFGTVIVVVTYLFLSVLDGFHPRGFSKLPVDLETRAGASSAAGAACGAHFLPSKAWAQNASC